jgi:hypothetical protein
MSGQHDTAECSNDNCVACAMTGTFIDMLATEKLDGHGPIDMLFKSWKNRIVGHSALRHPCPDADVRSQ